MKYIPFAILFIILVACNKETRIKNRANRKIEAARRLDPSLFVNDTIRLVDTVVYVDRTVDTLTYFKKNDTVTVINNDTIILKYIYNTKTNNIYHEATCKGDTVVVTNEVIVERIRDRTLKEQINNLQWWWKILIIAFICVFLFLLVKK